MVLGRPPQWSLSKYGAVALAAFLAFQAYLLVRPAAPPLDAVRAAAADQLSAEAAEALGSYAGDGWSGRYVKVARLTGDPYDHLRRRIEEALEARTNCILLRDSVLREVRDGLVAKTARLGLVSVARADGWRTDPVVSEDAALKLARRIDADVVVFGSLDDFRSIQGLAITRLALRAADVASETGTFAQTFETGDAVFASADGSASRRGDIAFAPRLVAWAFLVILLPVAAAPVWVRLFALESNLVNLACLVCLTVLDALLTRMLLGCPIDTVWLAIALTIATALGATWAFYVLNVLESARLRDAFGH